MEREGCAEKGGRGMSGLKNGARFDYTDPALTVIRMAEGNPGAAQAMMQAWR